MSDVLPADMANTIREFWASAQTIVNSYHEKLVEQPPPKLIYHYTDDKGLYGILSTGKIRFTDIFRLNDPSELKHGVGQAVNLLKQMAENAPREVQEFSEPLASFLNSNLEGIANLFVCSFSTADDELGQWRAYADDGRGYALGFDAASLERAFGKSDAKHHSTFPVNYEEAELHSLHKRVLVKPLR
jgi:Protein of unknown function (DUF2971)